MGLAMEAAAEAGVKFIVLDRVNPIGGATVAGPVRLGPSQFIAYHDIPVRHGMTVGELAQMINVERNAGCSSCKIVKIEGWKRGQLFDTTGQPWTNPSPNMRCLTQALLYPGIGLLETAMSVGRGTDTPFEVIGAPYINDIKLANQLNALGQPGVRFVPIRFTPDYSVHKDESCGGVNIIITDRNKLLAVPLGIDIARVLHELYPKRFPLAKVDRLLCHPPHPRGSCPRQDTRPKSRASGKLTWPTSPPAAKNISCTSEIFASCTLKRRWFSCLRLSILNPSWLPFCGALFSWRLASARRRASGCQPLRWAYSARANNSLARVALV